MSGPRGRWRNAISASDETREDVNRRVPDLALLLLYLTRWTKRSRGKLPLGFEIPWRSWKDHDWEALDRIKDEGLIDFTYRRKSVGFTDKGEREARRLHRKHKL